MGRILKIVGAGLVVFVVLILVRAATVGTGGGWTNGAGHGPELAVDAKGLADRFSRALRFATISTEAGVVADREAFRGLIRHFERSYPKTFETMEIERVGDLSLLGRWPGSDADAEPILLLAHLDVVPAADPDAWSHPAFEAPIVDGVIWGRGALDDKAGAVAMMEAFEASIQAGFVPTRDIYFAFGHDEEVGGANGAVKMAALLAERGIQFAWALDEGSVVSEGMFPGIDPPVALIALAEKGYLTLELRVEAKGGHSSSPPPETAVGILAGAVSRVSAARFSGKIAGPVEEMLVGIAPAAPFAQRVALANLWIFRPFVARALEAAPFASAMMRTTTAPTVLRAGTKDNILPREATALINFRVHPRDTTDSVIAHVTGAIADERVAITPVGARSEPSPVSNSATSGFRAIAQTAREMFPGVVVAPSMVIATTDSRHYAGVARDVYRFRPYVLRRGDLNRIHGVDERIPVADLVRMVGYYARLFRVAAG